MFQSNAAAIARAYNAVFQSEKNGNYAISMYLAFRLHGLAERH